MEDYAKENEPIGWNMFSVKLQCERQDAKVFVRPPNAGLSKITKILKKGVDLRKPGVNGKHSRKKREEMAKERGET